MLVGSAEGFHPSAGGKRFALCGAAPLALTGGGGGCPSSPAAPTFAARKITEKEIQKMARRRTIEKKVFLSNREYAKVRDNMRFMGSDNFSAYARKMLCDGYVVSMNFDTLREFLKPLGRIEQSLHTLARRANATGNIYTEDVASIYKEYHEAKTILKVALRRYVKKQNEGDVESE